MSYAVSASLQAAVYQHLTNDAGVAALVGADIYDAMPPGTPPGTYVTLGPEDVRDRSDYEHGGARYRLVISVVTDASGFHGAKMVAGAISDALAGANLSLARGVLVRLEFYRARARLVGSGGSRRIDMTFRARVDDAV